MRSICRFCSLKIPVEFQSSAMKQMCVQVSAAHGRRFDFLDPVLGHEEAGLLTFEALQGLPRFSGHTHDDTQDVIVHLISQSW